MENKLNARKGRTYLGVSTEINVANYRLISQDIQQWRRAIESAKSVLMPNRKLLYQLYDNIILDGHLQSVMEKRTMAITNQKMRWIGDTNNMDNIKDYVLETPWFYDYNKLAMQSIPFGHVLIELIPQNGVIAKAEEVVRENVLPEKSMVLWDSNNRDAGFNYLEDPYYSPHMIEVGNKKDLGKLMIAAQYVIYKRGGFGDWAQFAELFGMPFRVGKYDPYDPKTRNDLDAALTSMGGAGHVIIPEGTNLEFHDNNQAGKSEVFSELIKMCNSELSKLFLGQTMTTENGSSHSQSETHKNVEEEINLQDMIKMEYHLNWELKDKLINFGYPLKNGKFQFPETSKIPRDKRIAIDMQVAQQVYIAEDYWYETYGIPKPKELGGTELIKVDVANSKKEVKEEVEEEPKPSNKAKGNFTMKANVDIHKELKALYKHNCKDADCNVHNKNLPVATATIDELWDKVAKDLHSGKIVPGQISLDLQKFIANQLFQGVVSGFGGDYNDFYLSDPKRSMLLKLEQNVHIFSAFKTYHELKEATAKLIDENGKIRPFSEFKQLIANINEDYNKNYLKTEYNQAIASAQMSSNWVDITSNADVMPYLKYRTAGDKRVRESHKAMDGIIRPVNDSFWDRYYPPNDWACRCEVVQVAEGTVTDLRKVTTPDLKPEFDLNVGKKEVVFPKNHPYFKVQVQHQQEAKNYFGIEIPER